VKPTLAVILDLAIISGTLVICIGGMVLAGLIWGALLVVLFN
jgi:hypothetical protein